MHLSSGDSPTTREEGQTLAILVSDMVDRSIDSGIEW
jgi:hypothetical protein